MSDLQIIDVYTEVINRINQDNDNFDAIYQELVAKGAPVSYGVRDEYAEAIKNLGELELIDKTITQNGTYKPSSDGADGYSEVTVNVAGGGSSLMDELTATENKIYTASEYGYDGFKSVNVNVESVTFYNLDYLFYKDARSFNNLRNNINKTGIESMECAFKDSGVINVFNGEQLSINGTLHQAFCNCVDLQYIGELTINFYNYNRDIFEAFLNCNTLESLTIYINSNGYGFSAEKAFKGCSKLQYINGNLDLSYCNDISNMFDGCTSLQSLNISGSIGGNVDVAEMTLDLSASSVFNASNFITNLASNDSGQTRNILLSPESYDSLDSSDISRAENLNYRLVRASYPSINDVTTGLSDQLALFERRLNGETIDSSSYVDIDAATDTSYKTNPSVDQSVTRFNSSMNGTD